MYASVIVDIAHSSVDKIFEYSCTDEVKVGCRVKVPFGGRIIDGFVIGTGEECSVPPQKVKPVYSVYAEPPALVGECFSLMELISLRYRVPKAAALRLFVPSEMRLGKVHEAYYNVAALINGDIALPASAKKQAQVLQYLKERGECELSVLAEKFGRNAVNSLRDKGAVAIEKRQKKRNPLSGAESDVPKTLTPAQSAAIENIENSNKQIHLIHGVTGSGKTEIYLNIIARAIACGKTAIFLVPEISLTPQMLAQLRARFKGEAAILHSGLSAGERFDEWWRLRSGEAKIAVGARSAIFAPLENLGAIIIDEEHDSSYVSESAPRYSTVDIAAWRAKYNDCKLILGSATPSVERPFPRRSGSSFPSLWRAATKR